MNASQRADQQSLEAARAQRADLWHHIHTLENSLATPVPGRVDAWATSVHDALVDLAGTFERHVAFTEGTTGLFAEVLETAPRLEGAVASLRAEHDDIGKALSEQLRALRGLEDDGDVQAALKCRQALTELLSQLSRHRQQGADLVYEAYAVDIGVGD